jgi:Secretion system C-terminal sorting domain
MAFSAHDHLFMVTARQELYRIDPQTADTFFVGWTGHAFTGLAFSPATGVLWASARDTMCTLDPMTGNASIVGHSGWSVERSTIAFSTIGVLYGLFDNALVTIGRVWGETHSIGLTGVPELTAIAMRSDVATDVEEERQTVSRFLLEQNYPNPFNPKTGIRYHLPAMPAGQAGQVGVPGVSNVRLVVYDILGREVATLVNEKKQTGTHEVTFDGTHLTSGVYIYRMIVGGHLESRKMLMTK